jgi:hypothetical protein
MRYEVRAPGLDTIALDTREEAEASLKTYRALGVDDAEIVEVAGREDTLALRDDRTYAAFVREGRWARQFAVVGGKDAREMLARSSRPETLEFSEMG